MGNYNFPRSTNKIKFFDEISISVKKIVDLMKDLKYEHQSTFPLLCWLQFKYILMGQPIKLCTVASFINIHRTIFDWYCVTWGIFEK